MGGREVGPGAGEISPYRPFFEARNALAFDDQGRLWVRTTRGGPAETVFDVFDRSGGLRGELTIPQAVGGFAVRHGYLVGVTTGELDVPTVTIWRLREP
jgi:hypothetical protein